MGTLVVTTSYPAFVGDSSGHFVEAEVPTLPAPVHVLTPAPVGTPAGTTRGVHGELVHRVPGGGQLFGVGGVLPRLAEAPWRVLALPRWLLEARRQLARLPVVERVVAHWLVPSGFPLLRWVRRSRDARVEVVAHGSDVRALLALPRPCDALIERALLAEQAQLRVVSRELLALLAERYPRWVAGASVQPSPIDLTTAPRSRAAARRQLAWPESRPGARRLVVVVARLIAGKRVDVALRAATLLPRADVVVLGDGPLRTSLSVAFPTVRFLGAVPRPEALAVLAAADLVLSASLTEGAPTALREARALGTPVVARAAGDLREWAAADPDLWVVDGPAGSR